MITMKDIIRDGHPTLRQKAQPVKLPLTQEDIDLSNDMLEFLKMSQDAELAKKYNLRSGVGLAAPQINVPKQILVVYYYDDQTKSYVTEQLFNPKIISHSVEKSYLKQGEGCLSVDENIPGLVHRHARITVKAINIKGEEVKLRMKDFKSIVTQHEIDHLNGVMFYDHIRKDQPFEPLENAVEIH